MSNLRRFKAKDDSPWCAFPDPLVQVIDDPDADGVDPVVLVIDRKRAGALAVQAICNRRLLSCVTGLLDAAKLAGLEGDPIKEIEKLGFDVADALGWEVEAIDRSASLREEAR